MFMNHRGDAFADSIIKTELERRPPVLEVFWLRRTPVGTDHCIHGLFEVHASAFAIG